MTTRIEKWIREARDSYLKECHCAGALDATLVADGRREGFRHAIEVLEEWYSNNGGREGGLPHVGQAIHQLKLYAAKEEPNETD